MVTFKMIEPTPEQSAREKAQEAYDKFIPKKALVVFAYGDGQALAFSGPTWLEEMIYADGGSGGSFDMNIVDHSPQSDGVWICDLDAVNIGISDWDGGPEYGPGAKNWRLATKEEWNRHQNGEWPWDMPPLPAELEDKS